MSVKLKWSPGIIASDFSVGRPLINRILNYSANCRQLHCLKKTNFHYLSRIVYFCMIFVFMIPDRIRICTDAPAFTRSEFDCSFVVIPPSKSTSACCNNYFFRSTSITFN